MPYMVTIKTISIFETDDNIRHDTIKEAEAHNEKRALIANLQNAISLNDYEAKEVADYMLKHWTLTPKDD